MRSILGGAMGIIELAKVATWLYDALDDGKGETVAEQRDRARHDLDQLQLRFDRVEHERDEARVLLAEERDESAVDRVEAQRLAAAQEAKTQAWREVAETAGRQRDTARALSRISETTCARCLEHKWCPWREDGLGYICAGCLAKERDEAHAALLVAERQRDEARADLAQAVTARNHWYGAWVRNENEVIVARCRASLAESRSGSAVPSTSESRASVGPERCVDCARQGEASGGCSCSSSTEATRPGVAPVLADNAQEAARLLAALEDSRNGMTPRPARIR